MAADLSSLSTIHIQTAVYTMAAPDTTSIPLIAVVVNDVARTFLSLVAALEVHEDFKTQVPPTAAHDEFTRFKV
jgi:hypothetical protein